MEGVIGGVSELAGQAIGGFVLPAATTTQSLSQFAQVPEPILLGALRGGDLALVLPDLAPTMPGLFLCHLGHRYSTPKLRAFIEPLRPSANERSGAGQGGPGAHQEN